MVFHHIEQQLKSMTGHQWTLLGFKNKVSEVPQLCGDGHVTFPSTLSVQCGASTHSSAVVQLGVTITEKNVSATPRIELLYLATTLTIFSLW